MLLCLFARLRSRCGGSWMRWTPRSALSVQHAPSCRARRAVTELCPAVLAGWCVAVGLEATAFPGLPWWEILYAVQGGGGGLLHLCICLCVLPA